MKEPNDIGLYEAEIIEELARIGQAYAAISMCQCEDGLYRSSYCGFGEPISIQCNGIDGLNAAKEVATREMLRRFPASWPGDPQSVHDELREIRATIEREFRQPSLF